MKLKEHPERMCSEIFNLNENRCMTYGVMPATWEELEVVKFEEKDLFGLNQVIPVIYIK